jgi:PEGA domain
MDAAVVGLPLSSPQPAQLTFEDGLGERRYAAGAVNEPLEVLKLSSVISSVSSFDFALRERAARLAGFRHESYGRVRSIELDRRTSALVVVSDYVPGVRLSTILAEAHKKSVPLEINAVRYLIRQLVSAAAALQEAAPEVSNGAISLERLVITPSGRLTVVEYVLGAALEQLAHSRARYWRELGIALPGSVGAPPFDSRADVTQIGAVALALILGRPLTTDEYPDRLSDLIQGATVRSVMGGVDPLPIGLRDWLRRALQLDQWESFASPADARTLLDQALGTENAVAELGALHVFLARYTSSEVPADADLAPRLEAMKAFLARYPSRRVTTGPSPNTTNESPVAPPAAEAVQAPPVEPVHPLVVEPVHTPAAETILGPATEPVRISATEPAHTPEAEPARAEALPEPDLLLPTETSGSILSYAEERRSATPVIAKHRLRILVAAAGVLIVLGIVLAVLYFRPASAPATGTLSVGTSPAGISVFVDGTPHGVTPLGVELPPGEHVIELRTDTERRRIPVTLAAGAQVSQYFEFARPAQASGELLVRTDPSAASVTVDGKYVGRSPVSVPDLSAGTHTVVLQHDIGTLTERVLIENGRTASLVVSMAGTQTQRSSAAGWIRLDVPADVQVYENGRRIGGSDLERIMLPVGRHDLEFVNEALGYKERRTVQVGAGQVAPVRLEWPKGTMAINANPWAEVLVDGMRVGETPIGSIAVPIGAHEVVFRHPELGERRMFVTVTTGDPVKVGVDLRSK